VTQRNTIIVGAVAAVAAAAAFWFLALSPKREQMSKLDADIAAQETARDQATAQAAEYEKAKVDYEANYAKVVQLGKAVPGDDDVRSLLVQLEGQAGEDKVDFRLISVGNGGSGAAAAGDAAPVVTTPGVTTVPGTQMAVLPFSFGFTGKYFALTEFLGKVEEFVSTRNAKTDATGRLLLVNSFALKPDSSGFPNLRAEVGATSYVAPPMLAPGAAATPATGATPGAAATPATPAVPADGAAPPTTTASTVSGAVR
jgi:hypothetical protein